MKLWQKLGMPRPKSEASKGKLSFVDNEIYSGLKLPEMPFFVRLDGWTFHSLAKEIKLEKPFDRFFASCLVKTASQFFLPFNPCLAYIFSDEINFLFLKHTTFERIEKIDSVFASLASSIFYRELSKKRKIDKVAFDCRCIPIEEKDIVSYLIWRQAEAFRNCNNSYAQWLLQEKERLSPRKAAEKLSGLKTAELRTLIDKLYGLNKIELWHERGILLYRELYKKKGYNPIKKEEVEVSRLKVVEDWSPPVFAKNKELVSGIIKNYYVFSSK